MIATLYMFFNWPTISDKPHNPMINSGAIVTAALIKNDLRMADRFDYVSRAPVLNVNIK